MDKSIIIALILIVSSGVAYYLWQERQAEQVLAKQSALELPASRPQAPQQAPEPAIRYPLPKAAIEARAPEKEDTVALVPPPVKPLPGLDDSDEHFQESLEEVVQSPNLLEKLLFRNIIRHIVVSVDNLPRKKLPRQFVFTRKPEKSFLYTKTENDNDLLLDDQNYRCYQPFMNLLGQIDNQQLVSIYVRYYSLFQEAYEELGYPDRYFNDRLVEVLEHLLDSPQVTQPIKLVQPKVYLQFADPELEALSAGHKLLIRIGPENAGIVRERLQGLWLILTSFKP